MRSRWPALTLVVVMVLMLVKCSSGTPPIATPVISSILPDGIVAGSASFQIFITGMNFLSSPQSVVLWNGSPRTTVLNATTGQLIVTILASDVTNSGVGLISVMNAPPGGTTANPTSFSILPLMKGAPTITSLNPSSANTGTKGPFLLTVNGTNFGTGAYIEFNGSFRQPTTSSATALTTNLTTNDLATAGVGSVTVVNPLPGGIVAPSISVDFTIGSGGAANPAFPQLISVNALGGRANGGSAAPALSADGRFVAFYSEADNLVGGSPSGNIFVRDTCLGAANCTPKTNAIDLAPDGSAPDARSAGMVAISDDGRFVAFASYATNLVPGLSDSALPPGFGNPASRLNVFVRDMCIGVNAPLGCTPHTEIVTRDENGQRAFGGYPSISSDGRFVAFNSWGPNMATGAGSANTYLYVRDTCAGPTATVGCSQRIYPVLSEGTDAQGDKQTVHPVISSTGRYVAYKVWVPSDPMPTGNIPSQIFLRDMCLGADAPAGCAPSTIRIPAGSDGSPLAGFNGQPSLSSDARFVVFESQSAATQTGEAVATRNILLRDTCLGPTAPDGCVPSTKLIYSQPEGSSATVERLSPAISPSGRFISFVSRASGTAVYAIGAGSLFIYDTCFGAPEGCTPSTNPILAPGTGLSGQPLIVDKLTPIPLSADGRFAAFYSRSAVIGLDPVAGQGDVFLTVTPFK
jgi:hypothetical protein